jgi:phosphoglycerate dehydrogenase-like enzyme
MTAKSIKLVSLGIRFSGGDEQALISAGCLIQAYDAPKDLPEALRAAEDAEIVCVSNVWQVHLAPDFMNSLGRCRLVVLGTPGVGKLNMEVARLNGIAVASCPAYSAPAVAEYAFAIMLALARKLVRRRRPVSEDGPGSFDEPVRLLQGVELRGKTLGIAGYERIGPHLAGIAKSWDMKILVSQCKMPWWRRVLTPRHVHFVNFRAMLDQSDAIVSVLPGRPNTQGTFDDDAFSRMRNGCLFVNVGQPQAVDEDALLAALKQGKLGGAGLDIVSSRDAARSLRELDNVIVSHRVAWNTVQSEKRRAAECAKNVVRFLSGHPINLLVEELYLPPM